MIALLLGLAATFPSPRIDVLCLPPDEPKAGIADIYRMDAIKVPVTVRKKFSMTESGVDVFEIKFPSAVATKHAENNTVVAEYFRPVGAKNRPAVIVLDILDGAGVVSRGQAVWLASQGIPALTITMPYYGSRRPREATADKQRFLNPDVASSRANVRQGILDARLAVAWLEMQPEVDHKKLGVLGTSLGSFLGAILAANEPKLSHAALLLGGGGLIEAFADHPQAGVVTAALKSSGLTMDELKQTLAVVDPLTYAAKLKTKRLLLVEATRDDVVPPAAMERLWEATGKPEILRIDATHVGAAAHFFPMMNAVRRHVLARG